MATQGNGTDLGTLKAGADLTAKQFRFVKLDSNGDVVVCGLGEAAIGVLQNNPNIGQAATVRILGVSKVVADAAFAVGAFIKSSADGEAATAAAGTVNTGDTGATNDAVIGSNVIGRALKAAGGAGEIVPLLIEKQGVIATTAA